METITVTVNRGKGWEAPFEIRVSVHARDSEIHEWLQDLARRELLCSGDTFREVKWQRENVIQYFKEEAK